MTHMPCCGARLTPEGYHALDCEDVKAAQEEYEAMLAEEHEREARLTYPGDVRNIPGGY